MRPVTTSVANAINKLNGIKANSVATVYRNSCYFSSYSSNGIPVYAQTAGIKECPISQVSCYEPTNDKLFTFYVNPTTLNIEVQKNSHSYIGQVCDSSSVNLTSKAWHKMGLAFPYLFRIDANNNLYKDTLDLTTIMGMSANGNLNCVTSETLIETLTTGTVCSLCAISDTEFVMLKIDEGSISAIDYVYNGSAWVKYQYPHRFIFPTRYLDETDAEDPYVLHWFTASRRNDGLWIYLSYPTGEVRGLHLDSNNNWEDMFVAVPEDLSTFKIINSFVDSNQRIHISGMFQRVDSTGAYASDAVWNLLSYTDDGKVFSLEKSTLFSMTGMHFSVFPAGVYLYFVDSNRFFKKPAPYHCIYENAESVQLRLQQTNISGTIANGYDLILASPDDKLIDHPLIIPGNIVILKIGLNTTSAPTDFEYTQIDKCIITKIQPTIKDAVRSISLGVMTEGLYKIQQFSYPFYLEIDGKQSEYDPISDLSNMYEAPEGSGIREKFACDFWGDDSLYNGGGLPPMSHAENSFKTVMTADVKDYLGLTDYPVFKATDFPYTIKIFGWSRIGLPNVGDQPLTDSTPSTNSNDDFLPVLVIQHASSTTIDSETGLETTVEGEQETITLTAADVLTGSATYPPQYYKEGNNRLTTGAYPVQFSIGSSYLADGDMLIKIGVKAVSTSPTVFYLERVEIPSLGMYLDSSLLDQTANAISELSDYTPLVITNKWTFDSDLQGWVYSANNYGGWATGQTAVNKVSWANNALCINMNFDTDISYYQSTALSPDLSSKLWTVGTNSILHCTVAMTQSNHWWGGSTSIRYAILFVDGTTPITGYLSNGANDIAISSSYAGKVIKNIAVEVVCVGTFWSITYFDDISLTGVGENNVVDETIYQDDTNKKGLAIKNVGMPSIYFSTVPYSAFNFEETSKFRIAGIYTYAGLVGVALDAKNYICGRYKIGQLEIVKVRDGIETILATASYTASDTFVRMRFTHKYGDFALYIMESGVWGDPKLTYRWAKKDSEIAVSSDLYATGIYAYDNVPKFRICSFNSEDTKNVCILPGYDPSALDNFPSSGSIYIDGIVYDYTGKASTTINPLRGPYQARALFNYGSFKDPLDGQAYSGCSIEFSMFQWQNNVDHHGDYAGLIAMSNQGYGWPILSTEYKVWITTDGALVELYNRSRHFCDGLSKNDIISCSDKMFITYGLTGVTIEAGQENGMCMEGSYCFFYDTGADIEITDFYASNDDPDATVKDMVKKICAMVGVQTLFPGDTTYSSLSIVAGTDTTI